MINVNVCNRFINNGADNVVPHCAVGSQVEGTLTDKPSNTSVLNGRSAVLRCRSSLGNSAAVNWNRVVGGKDEAIVFGCTVRPQFTSAYSIISDDRGQCNFVVNSTNTSLTGLYTCVESTGDTAHAYLTTIGRFTPISCSYRHAYKI